MIKPIDYLQTDPRWGGNRYAAPGEKSTIRKSGCGPTCAASVIAALADPSITPADTAEWSMNHGFKAYNQGTYYSYFLPQLRAYGIESEQLNGSSVYHGSNSAQKINSEARAAIKAEDWLICCMGVGDWTRSGHFVIWYGLDGDYALIMDPNSKKASRRRAPVSKFQYQVKYYWRVETEETMTEEKFIEMLKKVPADTLAGLLQSAFTEMSMQEPAKWSAPAREWGHKEGIMTGGSYKKPATREEVIQVVYAYDQRENK